MPLLHIWSLGCPFVFQRSSSLQKEVHALSGWRVAHTACVDSICEHTVLVLTAVMTGPGGAAACDRGRPACVGAPLHAPCDAPRRVRHRHACRARVAPPRPAAPGVNPPARCRLPVHCRRGLPCLSDQHNWENLLGVSGRRSSAWCNCALAFTTSFSCAACMKCMVPGRTVIPGCLRDDGDKVAMEGHWGLGKV